MTWEPKNKTDDDDDAILSDDDDPVGSVGGGGKPIMTKDDDGVRGATRGIKGKPSHTKTNNNHNNKDATH